MRALAPPARPEVILPRLATPAAEVAARALIEPVAFSMTQPRSWPFYLRALLSSLGFGMSAAIVHLALGIGLILALGMPPLTWFAAKTIPMELCLALLAGMAISPLFLLRKQGAWLHPLVLALLWLGLERWVAIDPSKPQMWLGPPLGALLVYGLGVLAARWRRWLPVALCLVLPALLLLVPIAKEGVAGKPSAAGVVRGTPPANAPDDYCVDRLAAKGRQWAARAVSVVLVPVIEGFRLSRFSIADNKILRGTEMVMDDTVDAVVLLSR